MVCVPKIEERDFASGEGAVQIHAEDGTPGSAGGQCRLRTRTRIGVPGRIEEEGAEVRSRKELGVLRPLERRSPSQFCGGVGVKSVCAVGAGIVNRDPANGPRRSECMQLELVGGEDIAKWV